MGKKDMYIDYKSYRGNRGRNRNKRPRRKWLLVLMVILLSLSLGLGAYYLSKEGYIGLNFGFVDRLFMGDFDAKANEKVTDENSQTPYEARNESDNNKEIDSTITNSENDSNENHNIEETQIEELENQNQEESILPTFTRTPEKVKGIYVTGPMAGTKDQINNLVELVETTELNTMVIDIKNDNGEITYNMDLDIVKEIGANVNYIQDIKQLIKDLKKKDIYLIARIVAFKDPILAEKKPEFSLKNADGTLFKDKDGLKWVNPYNKGVWEYLVSVSKEAVNLGFDEIQFDYIRFSTDPKMKNVDFGQEAANKTKTQVITEFTKYAYEQLKPLGVFVSADVYGAIIDSKIDQDIVGQDYAQMAKYLDYICPMIYPSHYADGSYGIDYPDLNPYDLILAALNKSQLSLQEIPEGNQKAIVRPWLQDFTASWIANYKKYGPEEIRAQIKGVYDSGYEEWILWNGSNRYTEDGLLTE